MTREAKENQIISELYSKINEAGVWPGEGGQHKAPPGDSFTHVPGDPLVPSAEDDNSAMPVGSLEVHDATVRLMGSQLMIDTHYGSAVVVLNGVQHAGLTEDWADLAKQDKNAINAGEAAQRRYPKDNPSSPFDQQQHPDFEPELPEQ